MEKTQLAIFACFFLLQLSFPQLYLDAIFTFVYINSFPVFITVVHFCNVTKIAYYVHLLLIREQDYKGRNRKLVDQEDAMKTIYDLSDNIRKLHIEQGAPQEINISSQMRERVLTRLENGEVFYYFIFFCVIFFCFFFFFSEQKY